MDALKLLKQDHEKVRKLLDELAGTTDRATSKREDLLAKIATEIEVHTKIEEEIFYPAFRKAVETKAGEKLYHEAWEEHRAAAQVLKDLKKAKVDSPVFGGRAKVLKELVSHHADEEEEEMFPQAKKSMSKAQLEDLGEKLEQRKRQLMKRTGGNSQHAHA